LRVPASRVNLEGSTIKGMAFTLYNGRASWDAAGRLSAPTLSAISVTTTESVASRLDSKSGVFTLTRSGDTGSSMSVNYSLTGTAITGTDYRLLPTNASPSAVIFPAGAASVSLT